MRLDRLALAERLAGSIEPWILHGLLDAYETAFLAGLARRREADTKAARRQPQ